MSKTISRIIAILCAIVFCASAVLSGTLAWENEQQALNDLSGQKTKFVSVELLKIEKSDSTNEILIPDTVFYLYKENGTQIGQKYVTDENGKISVSLSSGNYYFEEVTPTLGYTYDIDENGNNITKYPFTVKEQDETVQIKAYNIKLKSALAICKTVINDENKTLTPIQKKTPFEFTVSFSDNGCYKYRIGKDEEKTLSSGEKLILYHGQTAIFEDIPYGVHYNVTETPVNGYRINSIGNEGNITDSVSVASFINKCDLSKLGSITVSKVVSGENADLNKEFTFNAIFDGIEENFTLKHGESKTFKGFPIGTSYKIVEEDYEDYIPVVKEYSGKITDNEVIVLEFENIYKTVSEEKYGNLVITKTVKGEKADLSKEFEFNIVFDGENAPESVKFKLRADEKKIFEKIPLGVVYTVTETDAGDYKPLKDKIIGTVIADFTSEIEYVNIAPDKPEPPDNVKLTVSKQIEGEYTDSDKLREFSFVLTVDGKATEFKLRAGEKREFEIPTGAVYELHESDYFAEGFSQLIVNGYGTAEKEPIDIKVINRYVGLAKVEIKGTKKWEMGNNTEVDLPDSITIRLNNGDLLVEEKQVIPDENGEWNYLFTVPKYNDDGSLASYNVEELPIENYRTTYNGYNVINTYIPPVEVQLPAITKVVQGENAPAEKFEFVLNGRYESPMPKDSEGNKKVLSIKGNGKLEIGSITYTDVGEYVYTITETNGNKEGWEYDNSIFKLIVTVIEKDNILQSKLTIQKDNENVENIVFTNIYDESELSDTVKISGEKIWIHGDNTSENYPEYIIVEVYGNGKLSAQRRVTSNDNWKYYFELPRFDDNSREITYEITEVPIKDYSLTVDGYDLVNTFTGKTPSPTDTPSRPQKPSDLPPPQTGDNSALELYISLMILSMLGIIGVVVYGKRKS